MFMYLSGAIVVLLVVVTAAIYGRSVTRNTVPNRYRIVSIDGTQCIIQRYGFGLTGWRYRTLYHPETESAVQSSREEAERLVALWTEWEETRRSARASGATREP